MEYACYADNPYSSTNTACAHAWALHPYKHQSKFFGDDYWLAIFKRICRPGTWILGHSWAFGRLDFLYKVEGTVLEGGSVDPGTIELKHADQIYPRWYPDAMKSATTWVAPYSTLLENADWEPGQFDCKTVSPLYTLNWTVDTDPATLESEWDWEAEWVDYRPWSIMYISTVLNWGIYDPDEDGDGEMLRRETASIIQVGSVGTK